MHIHLVRLDGLASMAAGQPTRVYIGDDLDNALGQATYAPMLKCYIVWLHSSLMPGEWRQDQLLRVFWHEVGHIRAGHVRKSATHWHPQGLPRRQAPGDIPVGHILLSRREAEADQMAAALRSMWPYCAYKLLDLLSGKERYP